jgi:hypothetical protein
MPIMPRKRTDHKTEAVLAALADFKAGFRRSRKGNLCRLYGGKMLTIFPRRSDGYFAWCVAGASDEPPSFSAGGYETEEDALSALWFELEGWAEA